jgi:hypothetical protein
MSLRNFLHQQQGPIIKSHNSVEGLLKSIAPYQVHPTPTDIPKNHEEVELNEKVKEFAEKALLTPSEKIEIEKINEEIETDLKNSFLNESVSIQEAAAAQNYYKMYRDRDEVFEAKISVEGTSLVNTTVRLMLETNEWNIFFVGKIYKDGRCMVPLKKMTVFPEGLVGKAKLEVIIDDTVFVPWEETFIIEGAKKVKVEIIPQTKVSVSLKDDE